MGELSQKMASLKKNVFFYFLWGQGKRKNWSTEGERKSFFQIA